MNNVCPKRNSMIQAHHQGTCGDESLNGDVGCFAGSMLNVTVLAVFLDIFENIPHIGKMHTWSHQMWICVN